MDAQSDFKEWLALLNAHQVDYLIVGGYALAFHGAPRLTGDLDVLIKNDPENARRICAVLEQFGMGSLGLTPSDFLDPDAVIQLGRPPVRIDILTSLTGVTWGQASDGRETGFFGDVPVHYLGRDELIQNKRALGRTRDLADLETLSR